LPRSLASASVRESDVWFELLRFGVGPERGSASASWGSAGGSGRSLSAGCSGLGPSMATRARLARRLASAALASAWKLDQAVLRAEIERAQEQALEQLPVDEAARLRVREPPLGGQALGDAITEEAPQVEPQAGDPAELAGREGCPRARPRPSA
jgi:hypothetical protein